MRHIAPYMRLQIRRFAKCHSTRSGFPEPSMRLNKHRNSCGLLMSFRRRELFFCQTPFFDKLESTGAPGDISRLANADDLAAREIPSWEKRISLSGTSLVCCVILCLLFINGAIHSGESANPLRPNHNRIETIVNTWWELLYQMGYYGKRFCNTSRRNSEPIYNSISGTPSESQPRF